MELLTIEQTTATSVEEFIVNALSLYTASVDEAIKAKENETIDDTIIFYNTAIYAMQEVEEAEEGFRDMLKEAEGVNLYGTNKGFEAFLEEVKACKKALVKAVEDIEDYRFDEFNEVGAWI